MEGNLVRLKKGDLRLSVHRMELSRYGEKLRNQYYIVLQDPVYAELVPKEETGEDTEPHLSLYKVIPLKYLHYHPRTRF